MPCGVPEQRDHLVLGTAQSPLDRGQRQIEGARELGRRTTFAAREPERSTVRIEAVEGTVGCDSVFDRGARHGLAGTVMGCRGVTCPTTVRERDVAADPPDPSSLGQSASRVKVVSASDEDEEDILDCVVDPAGGHAQVSEGRPNEGAVLVDRRFEGVHAGSCHAPAEVGVPGSKR